MLAEGMWALGFLMSSVLLATQKKLGGARFEGEVSSWRGVEQHGRLVKERHLKEVVGDAKRSAALRFEGPCGLVLDMSRCKVSEGALRALERWGSQRGLEEYVESLRKGERVNWSEDRAAGHHWLRAAKPFLNEIETARAQAMRFGDDVRSGAYLTARGEAFESCIVVGIGGSRLGPELAVRALEGCAEKNGPKNMEIRFLSTTDGAEFRDVTRGLDPAKTLVVVSSKSWTTRETAANHARLRDWLGRALSQRNDEPATTSVRRHCVACTACPEKVPGDEFAAVFRFWEFVGGRFSTTASPGIVPLSLACGSKAVSRFLEGARAVDDDLFDANKPSIRKLPALMALLTVFNSRILGLRGRVVVPYSARLRHLPAHLQQLDMESLGKACRAFDAPPSRPSGENLLFFGQQQQKKNYGRAPLDSDRACLDLVLGAPGTDCQHSFFQHLHQSPRPVPTEFVGVLRPFAEAMVANDENDENDAFTAGCSVDDWQAWDELMANFLAQQDALALGDDRRPKTDPDHLPGDRPSLALLLPRLDAKRLGALFAVYEHRVALLGKLVGVNPFDQPGVQFGKRLAQDLHARIAKLDTGQRLTTPATAFVLDRYFALRKKAANDFLTRAAPPRPPPPIDDLPPYAPPPPKEVTAQPLPVHDEDVSDSLTTSGW